MESLPLLQQFNNNASDLADEAITKLRYWKDKFNARRMKPSPEEIEAECNSVLNNLMKKMLLVIQKTLTGNENQELAARVRVHSIFQIDLTFVLLFHVITGYNFMY